MWDREPDRGDVTPSLSPPAAGHMLEPCLSLWRKQNTSLLSPFQENHIQKEHYAQCALLLAINQPRRSWRVKWQLRRQKESSAVKFHPDRRHKGGRKLGYSYFFLYWHSLPLKPFFATLLSISSEPRGMERIRLAGMENVCVTISASLPIPICSHCQEPLWAGFFQTTPYWLNSPPTKTCGTSTDSSESRAKAVPSSFEKSHHVCLMRNVSGRKVLSTAKQIFYFCHIRSLNSATSHPGDNCPEAKSPAGYSLFPPKTELNFPDM